MDGTLSQVLSALYQAHETIDRLQAEIKKRDERIAELEAVQHSGNGVATLEPHGAPV